MGFQTYLYGGLALTVAVLSGLYWYETKKGERKDAIILTHQAALAMADKAVAQAEQVNAENVAAVERLKAQAAASAAAAAKAQTLARSRDAALQQALRRIKNAPSELDGPVAPILRGELERLRVVPGAAPAPDSPDEAPSGAPHDLIAPVLPVTTDTPGS